MLPRISVVGKVSFALALDFGWCSKLSKDICGILIPRDMEANLGMTPVDLAVPIVDAIECAFNTSASLEPKSLAEAIVRPDGEAWVAAALAEIECSKRQVGFWLLLAFPWASA